MNKTQSPALAIASRGYSTGDMSGPELDAQEEALGAEMARALFECYGTNVGSNATNTLRFTDDVVKGFPSNGTVAPQRTTFFGLYARNAEFDDGTPSTSRRSGSTARTRSTPIASPRNSPASRRIDGFMEIPTCAA